MLAIFLSGSLAIAIVLMSLSQGLTVDLLSYLFGSIATVSSVDVWTIGVLGLVIVGVVTVFYRQLFLVSFDAELAESQGLRASWYELLVVIMAAVTVAISMRIVGVLLIGALMVMPTLSGMLLGRGFFRSHMIAIVISVVSVIVGITLSYLLGTATGGTIVVCALLCFLFSVIASRK